MTAAPKRGRPTLDADEETVLVRAKLPASLRAMVRAAADRRGITMSEYIRAALAAEVRREVRRCDG